MNWKAGAGRCHNPRGLGRGSKFDLIENQAAAPLCPAAGGFTAKTFTQFRPPCLAA